MIRSFKTEATRMIWEGRFTSRLPNQIQTIARRKLRMLNSVQGIGDLRAPPSNRLETLSGDRAGQWSIRINDQWRVCFTWLDGDALNVEICDYH
ncbi:MAG: type II toxin-antitoxin system RelE/ParE family toxin [Azoarcus sp.]|jgi:proteic killer suppression protein|nr:type II toxin-antitoxin system RelE/ParE family toxin [Azoarcus sp.]